MIANILYGEKNEQKENEKDNNQNTKSHGHITNKRRR